MKIEKELFCNLIYKMKIAHLVSTFPPHIGGMGVVCAEEASFLVANNPVTVLTLSYPSNKYSDDKFMPFTIKRLKPIFKCGDAGWITGLENYLKDADIVHLHYPFYGALGSLKKCKKLFGFSLVVTYHMDSQSKGIKKVFQNMYDKIYAKKIFELADKVIAVDLNHFLKSKFGRFIGKEKFALLNNGVDSKIFSPGGLAEWPVMSPKRDLLKNKKIILFVGNFLAVKNVNVIIDALPMINKDVVFAIVGGGYDEKKLIKKITKMKLLDRVIFLGNKFSRGQLADCYRSADIVVVPSLSESFSLVALEAMSCGTIVVSSDSPGMQNRIKNGINGYIIKENSAKEWANQIEKIFGCDMQLKIEIKKKARETAIEFDWSKHCNILNGIYRSVI